MNEVIVSGNYAGDDGGGISLRDTGGIIKNASISQNTTAANGGGIRIDEPAGELIVEDSEFIGNVADANDGCGGGIYGDDYGYDIQLKLLRTTFDNNSAYAGGAVCIYASSSAFLSVAHSTFANNFASDDGGAIIVYANEGGAVNIINSTFFANSTDGGGGAIKVEAFDGGIVDIKHTTISHNTAGEHGGGVSMEDGSLTLTDSIVANNTSGEGYAPDIYADTGNVDSTYSLIGDTTDSSVTDLGGSLLDVDAGLADELEDLGGPTKVLSLLATSPAIDAGRPSGDFPEFEQRGQARRFPRVLNGRVDMGAIEADRDGDGIQDDLDPLPNDPTNGISIPTLSHWLLGLLAALTGWLGARTQRRKRNKRAS